MEQEIWKVYGDFRIDRLGRQHNKGHLWEVSNLGRVKIDGVITLPYNYGEDIYYAYGGKHLHRMVAECHVPNPNNYNVIDHIDGDKHNNRADNLRWCTHHDNMMNPITRSRRIGKKRTNETRRNIAIATGLSSLGRHWYNDGENDHFVYDYVAKENKYIKGKLYHPRRKNVKV